MPIAIYYRTNAAIESSPLAFASPDDGPNKDDYTFITTMKDEVTLDEAFRLMNVVNGDELPMTLKVRSMMTGDVIVDEDGDVWYCSAIGWTETHWG